jgi:hypothetical protein
MRRRAWLFAAIALLACDPAFDEHAAGLRLAKSTGGPVVMFDLEAKPLPEIPFPNDLATRPDPTSPTGRRLNLSLIGPTLFERRVREKADQLDGFGVYAPITVRFDRRIDVQGLRERHRNKLLTDDAVYLVDVDPQSPGFGEIVPIDLGYWAELPNRFRTKPGQHAPHTGRFPQVVSRQGQYFDYDPRARNVSLVMEMTGEQDADGDGIPTDAEDTDGDGTLDHANALGAPPSDPGSTEAADALVPFYEFETNTLIIRPIMPLREATTYAVVLSRFITDEQKRPIESPFAYVNHARQTEALKPLADILPKRGLSFDDVAFAWSFTTQSATRDLVAIRRGLYGHGTLGWLADQFPAEMTEIWPWRSEASVQACAQGATDDATRAKCGVGGNPNLAGAYQLLSPLKVALAGLVGEDPEAVNGLAESYRYVDYIVAGKFRSPDFLVDRDGLASDGNPQSDDESFDVDAREGTATVGPGEVTFWCTIPKTLEYTDKDGLTHVHKPPFPVVLYGHGYGASRLEMLGFAGNHARFGLATCGLDAYGHGTVIDEDQLRTAKTLLGALLKPTGYDPDLLAHNLTTGRARDLNNDGKADSGGDFWTADTFHTRDILRQSAVDWLQFVRMLRGFDGKRTTALDLNGDGQAGDLAGDFNGDGVVDIGGLVPDANGNPRGNFYFGWGQSLGGILSAIVPAVEPSMIASAPTSGAGGLTDVAIRMTEGGAVNAVLLRMMGPLIVGDPVTEGDAFTGRYRISWMVPDTWGPDTRARVFVAEVPLNDGDVFTVRNLTREGDTLLPMPDRRFALVHAGQGFRVQFAADAWSATEKRARMGFDPSAADFQPVRMSTDQVLASGDRFRFEVFSGSDLSQPRQVIDTWSADTTWQGTVYPQGAPLVAPAEGMGHLRGTPDFRRFFNVAQAILDGGDPIAYAPLYFQRPVDQSDTDPEYPAETRPLVIPTVGDQNVPVNTGISMARAMGIVDFEHPRGDLGGLTEDDFLLAVGAYEGTETYPRWVDERGPYNFDVDDLDEGTDGKATEPRGNFRLRLTKKTPGGGIAAMRMPYMQRSAAEGDTHGFDIPDAKLPFDINTFMINQVSYFFMRHGEGISRSELDARCLQYGGADPRSCPFMPPYPKD